MIVVHYGVYHEAGEVQIPELVFTHTDRDSPKADDIINQYDKNPYRISRMRRGGVNTCASLFH
jgi:hypothetical protein